MELRNINLSDIRPFTPGSLDGDYDIHSVQPNGNEAFESEHLQRAFMAYREYFEQKQEALRTAWDQFELDKASGICAVVSGRDYESMLNDVRKNRVWQALETRALFDKIVNLEFPEGLAKNAN